MVRLYVPSYEDLWFRQMFMEDEETMSYNHHWGGTIPFPKEDWKEWYDYWIINHENRRFYRYLLNGSNKEFVREVAYHYDVDRELYVADVIVYSKFRGNGFGKQGLKLLCEVAKNNGVEILYDDIAIDNSAINMFMKMGFEEEYRTEEIIMLRKKLNREQ